MKNYTIVSVDIGGTKIAVSVLNKNDFLIKLTEKTILFGENSSIPNQVLNMIFKAEKLLKIKFDKKIPIGISSCGPFVIKKGLKYLENKNLCNNINKWKEIPIEEKLKKHFENIVVENDAVAALKAEMIWGAGKKHKNIIYTTWSTGIGFAFCVDGKILKGKNSNAGHFGHHFLSQKSKRQCGCGNFGDMESLISGASILKVFGTKPKDLFEKYKKKDKQTTAIIKQIAKTFAKGLYNATVLTDPEIIILGGSVFLNNKEILLPIIKNEFYKYLKPLTKGVKFYSAKLDKDLQFLSGAALVYGSFDANIYKNALSPKIR